MDIVLRYFLLITAIAPLGICFEGFGLMCLSGTLPVKTMQCESTLMEKLIGTIMKPSCATFYSNEDNPVVHHLTKERHYTNITTRGCDFIKCLFIKNGCAVQYDGKTCCCSTHYCNSHQSLLSYTPFFIVFLNFFIFMILSIEI